MRKVIRKIIEILDGTPAVYGQQERGQSLVEVAFVLPLLFMLIAGLVEVGWFANNYLALQEVTRTGASRGPVLTGDNSPLFWNNAASNVRDLVAPGQEGNGPADSIVYIQDPNVTVDPAIEATSLNYRNACATLIDTDFGFYNLIVCQMLQSLDPLPYRVSRSTPVGIPEIDDIVVSVFAIQTVNNANPANYDLDVLPGGTCSGGGEEACIRRYNDVYQRTLNFNSYGLPPARIPPAGFNTMVVGRYPTNANECTVARDATPANVADDSASEGIIERDPFDFIWNGARDFITLGGEDYYYEVWPADTGREYQRGFVWTGQHIVDDDRVLCWGSEWTIERVQNLLDLPGFSFPSAGDPVLGETRSLLPPSFGMVLVEMFWRHDLLLEFPLFSPVLNVLGASTTISAWSAYPVPSVDPGIIFNFVD